ncbi:MAG: ABC transporter ATP-binding protein [Thermodesulfobacteriota bacterium]
MILLKNIKQSYYLGPVRIEILKGIDLHINASQFACIVGSSGCGKTTLMNILGFLDTPESGEYLFEGNQMNDSTDEALSKIRNRKIGFVFQHFFLLPRLSAAENTALPLMYRGVKKKERLAAARKILKKVGMEDRADHKPAELSGGQQQRVAIARALAGNPSLILADEPTGALDKKTSREIIELFKDLNKNQGITIVMITHDPEIAEQASNIIRMEDGLVYPK